MLFCWSTIDLGKCKTWWHVRKVERYIIRIYTSMHILWYKHRRGNFVTLWLTLLDLSQNREKWVRRSIAAKPITNLIKNVKKSKGEFPFFSPDITLTWTLTRTDLQKHIHNTTSRHPERQISKSWAMYQNRAGIYTFHKYNYASYKTYLSVHA